MLGSSFKQDRKSQHCQHAQKQSSYVHYQKPEWIYENSFFTHCIKRTVYVGKCRRMAVRKERSARKRGEGFLKLRRRSCGEGWRGVGGCMIKAYILKSLTSPLVWLMEPTLQADRSKGLEKWCNYCFLNSGPKRLVWKKDLEEILQGILDSRVSLLHPSTPLPPTLKPHGPNYNPSHPTRLMRRHCMLRSSSSKLSESHKG